MKKAICLIPLFCFFIANADAPGKRAMSDSKISIKNTSRLSEYNFYWKLEDDSVSMFNRDSTFTIPGSGGRPMNATLWAINKNTNASTDTIFFSNYYEPDYTITIDTVTGNKLLYSKSAVSNGNEGGDFADKDGDGAKVSKSSRIMLFSGISLLALILLIGFFIRRKNSKNS